MNSIKVRASRGQSAVVTDVGQRAGTAKHRHFHQRNESVPTQSYKNINQKQSFQNVNANGAVDELIPESARQQFNNSSAVNIHRLPSGGRQQINQLIGSSQNQPPNPNHHYYPDQDYHQQPQPSAGRHHESSVGETKPGIYGQASINLNSKPYIVSSVQSASIKYGQRSGKVLFGKKSEVGEIQSSEADSFDEDHNSVKQNDRKYIRDLVDRCWQKDPLEERRQQQFGNEVIEIGNLLDGMSRDQPNFFVQESDIKSSLNRISTAELKLGDMISRHIKNHGLQKFSNSNFVVTNRYNVKGKQSGTNQLAMPERKKNQTTKPDPVQNQKQENDKPKNKKSKSMNAATQNKYKDVHKQLQEIMQKGKEYEQDGDKIHQLQCFRPRELFNINTHALFQTEKEKDPLDSDDDSNDDEEDINRLLRSNNDLIENKGDIDTTRELVKNARIDLKAYDPNKKIEHNIKVLRGMIDRAKKATNTNRSASLAQSRHEQLKMSKFFKKDSNFQMSKIARETAEAIKYLNKRQPLTVQNTQQVDDEQLFSLPSKQKIGQKHNEQSKILAESPSQSPVKSQMQLYHTTERAKFFRNTQDMHKQPSHDTEPDGIEFHHQTQRPDQSIQNGRRNKVISHTNSGVMQKKMATGRTGGANQYSPIKMSQSTSRSHFLQQKTPSTFSRQGANQATMQSAANQFMHIQSGESDCQNSRQNSNVQNFNPVTINNPQIINNITIKQKKQRTARSQKRFTKSTTRGQLTRKTTHGSMDTRATNNQANATSHIVSSQQILRQSNVQPTRNASGNISSLNFHPNNEDVGLVQTESQQFDMQTGGTNTEAWTRRQSMGEAQQSATRFGKQQKFQTNQFGAVDSGLMGKINETMESKSFAGNQSVANYSQENFTWNNPLQSFTQDTYSMQMQSNAQLLQRKKSSAIVKVDQTVLEKVPSLNLMEMLRILDARNADMGLKKQLNQDDCTPQGLEKLLFEFTNGNGQGPAQRFKDYCDQNSVNRKLILQNYSLGHYAAEEIASILAVNPDIVHVDLSKNNLQDEGVEALIHVISCHQSIIHLDLTQNNISAKGAKKLFKALVNNITLISLRIGNIENVNKNRLGAKAVPKLNQLLQTSQILSFLDLRSTNLTDSGIALLCKGLVSCKTLMNLNVSKNDITSTGIEKFAPILYMTSITELDLSLNPLGNNGVKFLAEHLFERIEDGRSLSRRGKKCNLVRLNLIETKFQENGVYHLCKQLVDYHSLQYLFLDYNQFETKNMTCFVSLMKSTRLHTLSLNYCKLGDEGGVHLGEAVMFSNSIRDLSARHCEFGDTSAKSFAHALEANSNVERLDLSNNLINDAGGELIGLSIASNRNLKYLNLRRNNMRATSGAMFQKTMKENKTLKCIKLQKNSINIHFLEEIERFVERNNLFMLDNNVNELKHDREGYLATRVAAWANVHKTGSKQIDKIAKLEKSVAQKKILKAKLADDLKLEMTDLDASKKFFKEQTNDKGEQLQVIQSDISRMNREHDKKMEDTNHANEQAMRMINLQTAQIEVQKTKMEETRYKFQLEENAEDIKLQAAERLKNKTKKEKEMLEKELQEIQKELDAP